MDDDPPSWV